MQRAFLEWAYAKFEVDKLSQVQHFQCPACTPTMLAVAVDGNRKLYRFKSQPGCVTFKYNEKYKSSTNYFYKINLTHIYIYRPRPSFLMESFWPVMLRCPPLLITSMEKLDM